MLNETNFESLNQQTESHRWVKPTDHNGNAWSDEQVAILNHVAHCVETDQPIRVAIDAVAGSGKTTVLRGILVLLSNAMNESAHHHLSLSPMAFNRSIASVLADTMNAVKPDGADWVSKGSGTLNGHGLRTVKKAFSHPMSLSNAKYTMLSRWAVMEMLSDPLMLAEFDAETPVSEKGNKRYQSAWFGLCRFVKSITEKAMGYGLFVDSAEDYTEAWHDFLRLNRASLRITDVAMGAMIEEHLPVLVRQVIDTGMAMVADPTLEIRLTADAVAHFKMGYDTVMSPVSAMPPEWVDGLGAEHRPTLKTTSGDCGGSIHRYRTGGRFAHDRVHITLPYVDDIKALNNAIRDAPWSARFGHANSHRDSDRWNIRPADCDDLWVRSIKDTPECINGFTAIVQQVCGIDISPLFGGSAQPTEEQTTATALVAHIDCIYAPIYMGLKPWRTFDLILADEVQDMSVLQGTFMRTLMREGGNAVVVGDPKQSLYLFSGASSQSMSENIEALDCTVFPMTYCYRLTATLSREVRLLMGADEDGNALPYRTHRHPEYIASWAVGERSSAIPHSALTDRVQLGDMVLCRIGSPLVEPAMRCLREGIPVRIAGGGDLEKGVRSVCDSIGIAGQTPIHLTTKIEDYLHDEVHGVLAKLMRSKAHKGDEASARKDDQYIKATQYTEAISALVRRWSESESTLDFCAVGDAPQDWLADLFCDPNADGSGFVMFSSVHRAKGLEARHVFIITDRITVGEDGEEKISPTFMLPWSMNNDAEIEQERNAVYVALTRAMKSNTFVSYDGGACFFASIGGQDTAEAFLRYLSGDDMDEAVHEDDDDTDEAVVESEPENAPAEDETTPTPTDGAEDDSESTQDATTHEFAMMIYTKDIGVDCDGITDSPAEAQAFLEEFAQSFTTPYEGGTWLDADTFAHPNRPNQVAVFALWQDCPAEVLLAVSDYRDYDDDRTDDDTDDDGDAVSTDDDPTDGGEAPTTDCDYCAEYDSTDCECDEAQDAFEAEDDSTVDDEPQADVHPQALGCSWGDTMVHLATPTTLIRSTVSGFESRSRVKTEERALNLMHTLQHAVDCPVCMADLEALTPNNTITDATLARLQNTTVGTIRRVLDHIASVDPESHEGEWEYLPLVVKDNAHGQDLHECYAICERSDNGRIKRNTAVEIEFAIPAHTVVSEPIEETDDTTTVESIVEAIEETKGVFERVFAVDVDDSPQPAEVEIVWVRQDAVCSCGKALSHHTAEEALDCLADLIGEAYANGEGADLVAVDAEGYLADVSDSPQPAEDTPLAESNGVALKDIHGEEYTLFTLTDAEQDAFMAENRNAPLARLYCEHDGVGCYADARDRFAYYTGLSYCEMKPRTMVDMDGVEYAVWLFNDAECDEDTERIQGIVEDITNTQEDE